MKRSGGSRSFRSLGSRMRAFGRSLMRHYVPPEDMPPLDMSAPGWQSAAETPLMWPEASASNAPAGTDDQTDYFDAPEENISLAAPRQQPAPAAPPPAQAPVQRRPAASNKGVNPVLFDMLAKHDVREAERQRIRNEKKSAFDAAEVQRQADPDAPPIRRRGRMSVDYVETGTLAQGDDLPARPAKPAASEPSAPVNDNPVQRQPHTNADADDGAEIFEDWNVDDDDVGGSDDDNGGTPPPIDPAPTPLTPPGIAQRFPAESSTFSEESGSDFEVENEADTPQNFADVSVPSSVETHRPAQIVQRDFQPTAPETFYDDDEAADIGDADYLESEVSALGTLGDQGYETSTPDVTSQPIQRDYQAAAPDAPAQPSFQQSEFFDAPSLDDEYVEDGDTRPMPVQRAPVLPPPTFDEASDETGYHSLSDWVDAHSEPSAPTAPPSVQRDYQPSQSDNFDVAADDGDTRPMTVQRDDQPFADDSDFDAAPYAESPAPEIPYAETFIGEGDTFEAEADDGSSGQSTDSFTWSGDNNPPPANSAQRQANADVENFTDDTGDDYPAPEYEDDEYDDFDAPEQQQDETVYSEYTQPETGVQPVDSPINTVQRQPETIYDDDFAVENADDYQVDAPEYAAPDEIAYDDFTPPEQGGYTEYNPPQADSGETGDYNPPSTNFQVDNTPDFAPPQQAVQRQPEAVYDESVAAENTDEYFGEAEAYVPPLYDDSVEPETSDIRASEAAAQPDSAPTSTVQRQPQVVYDEPFADDASEFDVNDYAAPVADSREIFSPTNTVQRQADAPEMVDDAPLYGDSGVADYADYTYHRHDDSRFGDSTAPDFVPPSNTVQRQPDYVDDDDSSLYDSNYQPEYTEFIPAARNLDVPTSAPTANNNIQRSEQPGGFEPTNMRPPPFYGDDVYETDISALLNGQPDPRPLQRRAELPDIAPETYYEANAADDADTDSASVDLYQAMLQTGMVTPDGGFDSSPVEAAPPSIQRVPDDQSASQPLDLFQAMMETGMVQADRDDDYDAADEAEPMSAATRMDLLSLLDTPPAPRANMNPPQIVENTPSPAYQPPPTSMVQRALNNEEIEQPEQPEESEKEAGADVNVDQLARDVYNALRNRLRIERERRDHKS